jgi:hypothetical protein
VRSGVLLFGVNCPLLKSTVMSSKRVEEGREEKKEKIFGKF